MGKCYSRERDPVSKSTVTVKYSDIPNYLRESAFYKSLSDEDPESTIEIPAECFQQKTIIVSEYDFYCHLQTFQFWCFETIPQHILDYCDQTDPFTWMYTAKLVLNEQLFRPFDHCFTKFDSDRVQLYNVAEIPLYLLPYWIKHHPPSYLTHFAAIHAASNGVLEVLTQLRENGYVCDEYTSSAAARNGHLECLQFLHESGCPWDEDTCADAATYGHFECLKYAHENGCPWNDHVTEAFTNSETKLFVNTINFEWIRYVLEKNCPIHTNCCTNIAKVGRLDCLQLLYSYNAPRELAMDMAVRYNQLSCVQYLHETGCAWYAWSPEVATDVHILRYLIDHGCPYNSNLLVVSALWPPVYKETYQPGQLENRLACLQYICGEQGMYMPEDGTLFCIALIHADVECVQYLIDIGCPCNNVTIKIDTDGDDNITTNVYDARLLPCLQYAVEHGWQYNRSIINYVCFFGLQTCIDYLMDHAQFIFHIETTTHDVAKYIAVYNDL